MPAQYVLDSRTDRDQLEMISSMVVVYPFPPSSQTPPQLGSWVGGSLGNFPGFSQRSGKFKNAFYIFFGPLFLGFPWSPPGGFKKNPSIVSGVDDVKDVGGIAVFAPSCSGLLVSGVQPQDVPRRRPPRPHGAGHPSGRPASRPVGHPPRRGLGVLPQPPPQK